MTEKLPPFDAAQYLQTPEDISFFLNDALATDNIIYIAHAIGVVVRAKGMTDLSAETDIAIDELHRIFSGDENNTLEVMLCVLDALGVKLTAVSQHEGSVWPADPVV